MRIIDRRLNPGGKSLANRQRFIRRVRSLVRRAVREETGERSIKDVGRGGEVTIPSDGVHEPTFRRTGLGGVRDYLLPGNKKHVEGDLIRRPPSGEGQGSGGSTDGGGEDEFRFMLSNDEFIDLFLEDLELPDLAKRQITGEAVDVFRPAGYSVSGPPSRLSVARTMRNSLSRRIALKRPRPSEMDAARAAVEALEADPEADADDLEAARAELARLERRARAIPYIDPIDVRYRRVTPTPKPIAQAVMFCLMDVSGSMDEHMKDLAKRFYSLLYLFLRRRYRRVEVVFIRHTHLAREVDEDTFFYSTETGGTVVSTALEEMIRIARERFSLSDWNIYAAQASDGDNSPSDNAKTAALLNDVILPMCQYYAYLEVGAPEDRRAREGRRAASSLWRAYSLIMGADKPMAMRKVWHRREIYPVFRELFKRKADGAADEAVA
ncbi:MAG: YeaH/YhbH family protein [Caulobacterales bacterium]|nr:YeaH/YhbH family protein [Caulobacterales bacterium]